VVHDPEKGKIEVTAVFIGFMSWAFVVFKLVLFTVWFSRSCSPRKSNLPIRHQPTWRQSWDTFNWQIPEATRINAVFTINITLHYAS